MYVYLNGKIVPSKEAVVSVFDHGFLYGDGIYETMRAYDGIIFKLDEHLNRLSRSASLISLSVPLDVSSLKIALYETLIANSLKNAYIRLTVSRGSGAIGLDPDLCPEPAIVIITQQLKEYPQSLYKNGINLIIAETRRNHKDAINPLIKSLNFLNNILAKIEAKRAGAYEAVMLNTAGKLTEGTISNLFFYKDNVLCTPSIDCGILDGITRGIIIDIAKNKGIHVKEDRFVTEDIYSAQEVFITNTTLEVMPVSCVDEYSFKPGDITRLLRNAYRKEVKSYLKKEKTKKPLLGKHMI